MKRRSRAASSSGRWRRSNTTALLVPPRMNTAGTLTWRKGRLRLGSRVSPVCHASSGPSRRHRPSEIGLSAIEDSRA